MSFLPLMPGLSCKDYVSDPVNQGLRDIDMLNGCLPVFAACVPSTDTLAGCVA